MFGFLREAMNRSFRNGAIATTDQKNIIGVRSVFISLFVLLSLSLPSSPSISCLLSQLSFYFGLIAISLFPASIWVFSMSSH